MSIYNEYKNSSDKETFFHNLSIRDKLSLLINELNEEEKVELLEMLSPESLKELMPTEKVKKILFKYLDDEQIKKIYDLLEDEEKKWVQDYFENQQKKDTLLRETAKNEINRSNEKIISNNSEILKSNRSILEDTRAKKKYDKLTKSQGETLEILEEKTKKLQNQLLKYKLGPLDKIGIFSKRKLRKLEKINSRINALNVQILATRNEQSKSNDELIKIENRIEKEKEKIKKYEEEIKKEKENKEKSEKMLQEKNIRIQFVNHSERNIFGKKLASQLINERNKIIMKEKKAIQQKKQESKTERQQVNNNSTNQNIQNQLLTEEEVLKIGRIYNDLVNVGVNFLDPNSFQKNRIPYYLANAEKGSVLAKTTIVDLVKYQVVFQALAKVKNQQQQVTNEEVNVHSKGFTNVVNLSLLLSLILFIFSLVLFFIK